LRADHIGCIGGGNLTPNIDRLARDSLIFTKAFANGPGTNQSFPAILTSTYFLMHGGMRLLPGYITLAEVLRSHGFKTVAFHSNPFLSKSLGWNRGFDEFYDFIDVINSPSAFVTRQQSRGFRSTLIRFGLTFLRASQSARVQRLLKKVYYRFSHLEMPYLEGRKLNEHVINWVKRNLDEKFFLWMHYMDPHYPYVPPEEYISNFLSRKEAFDYNLSANYDSPSKQEVEIFRNLYEGEVRHTDSCIGELFQFLEDKNLMADSLILLMGDHGHAFVEHGRFGHSYDILYNEVLHVPLIMWGSDMRGKIDNYVQLLDVPPTILNLLRVGKVPTFMGRNLLEIEDSSVAIFSESAKPDLINLRYDTNIKAVSCIKEKAKLIINEMQGTIELYNLEKDFQERNNLLDSEKDLFDNLTSLIKMHLSHKDSYRRKMFESKEEEKIKERLRDLGYI
jgi:arylsulfatase A-like enzyme